MYYQEFSIGSHKWSQIFLIICMFSQRGLNAEVVTAESTTRESSTKDTTLPTTGAWVDWWWCAGKYFMPAPQVSAMGALGVCPQESLSWTPLTPNCIDVSLSTQDICKTFPDPIFPDGVIPTHRDLCLCLRATVLAWHFQSTSPCQKGGAMDAHLE